MALGVDSFSLLETVGSFGAICGNGVPVIPYGIEEIKKRNNISLWKRDFQKEGRLLQKKFN